MRPDGTEVTQIADAPGVGVAGDIAWQPIHAGANELTVSDTADLGTCVGASLVLPTTHGVAEFPTAVVAGEGGVWVTGQRTGWFGRG